MIFTEKTYCATFVKNFEIVEMLHDNDDKILENKLGTTYLFLLNNISLIENLFNKYIDLFLSNQKDFYSDDSNIISHLLNNLEDDIYKLFKNSFISNLIYYDLLQQLTNKRNSYFYAENTIDDCKILIKNIKNAIENNDIDFINKYILSKKSTFSTDEYCETLYHGDMDKKISFMLESLKDEKNRLSEFKKRLVTLDKGFKNTITECFHKILYDICTPLIYLSLNILTLHKKCDANTINTMLLSGLELKELIKNTDDLFEFLTNTYSLQIPRSYNDYCVINNNIISFPDIFAYNDSILTSYTLYTLDSIKDFCNVSVKHILDNGLTIVKCENCNKYFIPANRSDEKYCSNSSPQNPNKTCKEYGAKKAYRDKVNSNRIKKAHYNTSQFFRMKIKRAKTEKEINLYTKLFDSYKSTYEKQKKKYNSEKLSEKDFVTWIIAQKNIN